MLSADKRILLQLAGPLARGGFTRANHVSAQFHFSGSSMVTQASLIATRRQICFRASTFSCTAPLGNTPSRFTAIGVPPGFQRHNTSLLRCSSFAGLHSQCKISFGFGATNVSHRCFGKKAKSTQIQPVERTEEEGEGEGQEEDSSRGYLPFRPPFHTFNVIMILFILNILCYLLMKFGNNSTRDFLVTHFTLSRENCGKIYPLVTNVFFQENLLQLLIDCWLLSAVGSNLLSFVGNARLSWLCLLCVLGGSFLHLGKQQYFLFNGEDDLAVRGRVYGPNTFIMGLISLEGLIFRHMLFIQQPAVPYLILTAFVMALDVWRIATITPEEHGAATGGALMAFVFWALPIRLFGMDKLTALF